MTGRRKHGVWNFYSECVSVGKKTARVKCKKCKKEVVALVARMKNHVKECCADGDKRTAAISSVSDPDPDDPDDPDLLSGDESQDMDTGGSDSQLSVASSTANTCATSTASCSSGARSSSISVLATETQKAKKKLDSFVFRTTANEKKALDLQVARFVYATNSPFKIVEHLQFKKMIESLRPGYHPPNRFQIGAELLEEVYDSIKSEIKKDLSGKIVCMSLDGWSNVRNDSIVCICVTDVLEEKVHLINTIDTEDNSHTSEYLLSLAIESVKECRKLNCIPRSFVTDNASNMSKMRRAIATSTLSESETTGTHDILTYGCSAHILNLLAQDIQIPTVKEQVKKIVKYFRNVHFAAARYKQAGGKALVLPQDVRWNTLADCLESYLKNWHILSKVCTENRAAIESQIASTVHDMNLKMNAQDFLEKLKLIAVALDRIQSDICTISECTEIWIELLNKFKENFTETDVASCVKRFEMAMTPAHYLANILDHRFRGSNLDDSQREKAMEYAASWYPDAMSDIISYQAEAFPFRPYLFSTESTKRVKPIVWWNALKSSLNCLNTATIELVQQLHCATASSAGLERLFSAFGLVHTTLRNRLGTVKTAKLVTMLKYFNSHGVTDFETV